MVGLIQKFGVGALIAKADIKEAFRNIPIRPQDHHLLGFKFEDLYYYDKVLPMGASVSCAHFESFSQAIQWLLINHFKVTGLTHYDDFIFVGPPHSGLCLGGLR